MKFAHDLPGYAQGHRFSSAPEFFDSANQRFHDLAGYNRFGNYVEKINGTPVFAARGNNAREGLYLDNTNQWRFPNVTPWHGSGLVVMELATLGGAVAASMWPLTFGASDVGNITNDGNLLVQYNFGTRRFMVWGPSAQANSIFDAVPNNAILIFAWSRNQQDRMYRKTQDAVTITAEGPYQPAATNGNNLALASAGSVRMGNLTGNRLSNAVSTVGTMHMFEQHYWKGDVLRDNPVELKAFIDTLKTHYGIA